MRSIRRKTCCLTADGEGATLRRKCRLYRTHPCHQCRHLYRAPVPILHALFVPLRLRRQHDGARRALYLYSPPTPLLLLSAHRPAVHCPAVQLERRRLKALAGKLERAFEEVRARATQTEERRVQAEMLTAEALEASTSARKETEIAQLRSAQVEQVARLQETERTSTAQARAQSATELSTSRRLKAELARAVAFQERQARGAAVDSHTYLRRHNGGDKDAGTGVGFNRLGTGGGTLGLPSEATSEPGEGFSETSFLFYDVSCFINVLPVAPVV